MNFNIPARFRISGEREDHEAVNEYISKSSVAQGTNLYILFFAILIASLGLNVNSTAVVIGAMLISPLIGPIVGVGFGVATNNLKLTRTAFTSYLFSTVVGLTASTIYFLITPLSQAHSEILSRTQPSVYDVMIAFFGGFAGIIAISSKQKGNVIPGVAIATAIMPPLCTAGYGLATLQFTYFAGAFYLFLINSVFIFAATLITANLLKFPKKSFSDPVLEKKEKRLTWLIITLTLLPSLFLSRSILKNDDFIQKANRFIEAEAKLDNNYLLNKEIVPRTKSIVLTYGGSEIDTTAVLALRGKLKYYKLDDAFLSVHSGFSFEKDHSETQVQQLGQALTMSSGQISNLESQLDSIRNQFTLSGQLYKELKILYPDLGDGIIQPVAFNTDSSATQAFKLLVMLDRPLDFEPDEKERLKQWFRERTGSTEIEIVVRTPTKKKIK